MKLIFIDFINAANALSSCIIETNTIKGTNEDSMRNEDLDNLGFCLSKSMNSTCNGRKFIYIVVTVHSIINE